MTLPYNSPRRRAGIVVGVLTATAGVAVALTTFFSDVQPHTQISLLIALIGVLLGIAIDHYFKVADLERSAKDAIDTVNTVRKEVESLGPIVHAPASFGEFGRRISPRWTTIEENDYTFFKDVLNAYKEDFSRRLSDLSDGSVCIASDAPYSFRSASFERMRQFEMVDLDLDFWLTNRGKSYLYRQAEQIQRGQLIARRIFVANGDDHDAEREVIRAQTLAGIHDIRIVRHAAIRPEHRKHIVDQGVVTDEGGKKMLVRPLKDGTEILSYRSSEISLAEYSMRLLRDYSEDVLSVYPDL